MKRESFLLERPNGSRIENEFFPLGGASLGIVFSGLNYTYRNPLLYYSRNLLLEREFDYWGLDYRYYADDFFQGLDDAEKNSYFETDNTLVIERLLDLCELPRGDHCLEVNEVMADIDTVKGVIREMKGFLETYIPEDNFRS